MAVVSLERVFVATAFAFFAPTFGSAFVHPSQQRGTSSVLQQPRKPTIPQQPPAVDAVGPAFAPPRINSTSTAYRFTSLHARSLALFDSRFEEAQAQQSLFPLRSIWVTWWALPLSAVVLAIASCFALAPTTVSDGGIATIRAAACRAETEYSAWECTQRLLRIYTLYYFTVITGPVAWLVGIFKLTFFDVKLAPLLLITFWFRLFFACLFIVLTPFTPLSVLVISLVAMARPTCWWAKDQGEGLENDMRFLPRLMHMQFIQMAVMMAGHYSGEAMLSKAQIDSTFSKDFWRRILVASDCRIPPEVGRKAKNEDRVQWKDTPGKHDLVLKEESGALGRGDGYLTYGKDFTDEESAESALKARNTAGCPDILLLRRIYPREDLGVHCLRIITARDPNGKVGVMWTAIQIDSQTWTSHNGKHQNRIDSESETIVGRDQWFRNRATWELDENVLGKKLPGVQAACEAAIRAHETALREHPTRYFVGWDCMWTDDGSLVWFEGNTVQVRLGRIIFASWETVFAFIKEFAWSMGPSTAGYLWGRSS